ncbi:uncharacterized protein LOC107041666 isoform X3 [Diachasma alloeum]|uniref:uncharacterized protein LOC107041666 isoform X3 n=1 Tax=Diachasma alloeum TaxID=454923 RepID=UPI00073817EE|nr:uncharacterized protein LOC107041666 isoform X3 [Diachasma alloeum]
MSTYSPNSTRQTSLCTRRRMKRLEQIRILQNTLLNCAREQCNAKTVERDLDGRMNSPEKFENRSIFFKIPPGGIKQEPEDYDDTGNFLTVYQPEVKLEPEDSEETSEGNSVHRSRIEPHGIGLEQKSHERQDSHEIYKKGDNCLMVQQQGIKQEQDLDERTDSPEKFTEKSGNFLTVYQQEIKQEREGPDEICTERNGNFLTIYQQAFKQEPDDSDEICANKYGNFGSEYQREVTENEEYSDKISQERSEYCSRVQQLEFIQERDRGKCKALFRKPAERRYLPPTTPGGRRRLVRSVRRHSRKKIFRNKRRMKALEQARIADVGLLNDVSATEDSTAETFENVSTVQMQGIEKTLRLTGEEDFDKIFEKESLSEDVEELSQLPIEFQLLNKILHTIDDPPEIEILDF